MDKSHSADIVKNDSAGIIPYPVFRRLLSPSLQVAGFTLTENNLACKRNLQNSGIYIFFSSVASNS